MIDPNANTPIAERCKEHGCHYAGFLQQASGLKNCEAENTRLRAALEWYSKQAIDDDNRAYNVLHPDEQETK